MSRPLAVRVLVGWLLLVAAVPALLGAAVQLGVVDGRLVAPVLLGSVVAGLGGLAVFERPRGSLVSWRRQLEARLLPSSVTQSPTPSTQESHRG